MFINCQTYSQTDFQPENIISFQVFFHRNGEKTHSHFNFIIIISLFLLFYTHTQITSHTKYQDVSEIVDFVVYYLFCLLVQSN